MKFLLDVLLLLPLLIVCSLESFVKLFIPKRRKSVTGEIVLITGAGHGIGRLTAYEFAKLKSKLVLWDINKVTAQASCYFLALKLQTLFYIYVHMPCTTKAFLPAMTKNNHGHIVTVASAAGHVSVPFLLAYCSSKFAAVGFHKTLTDELAALQITGVKTTCLCPNFVNTGFIKNPSTSLGPTLEPEEVVNRLMHGILTEQKMIFIPSSIAFLTTLERILPERFLAVLKRKISVKFDAVIGYKMKAQ
uniref:Estradiol 17-beta-dehydrogenase 11 n=1 Tax=Gorilla gorilla gorilla TaxID=9595 RepID=A0A2I2YYP8_GORGO